MFKLNSEAARSRALKLLNEDIHAGLSPERVVKSYGIPQRNVAEVHRRVPPGHSIIELVNMVGVEVPTVLLIMTPLHIPFAESLHTQFYHAYREQLSIVGYQEIVFADRVATDDPGYVHDGLTFRLVARYSLTGVE